MRKAAFMAAFVAAFFVSEARAASWITGPHHGLHPVLKRHLHRMHKAFGRRIHITPHGGCRLHGNPRAPRSYHRIAAGCKAADFVMHGVSRRRLLAWWARHVGGGRGFYCGRRFVHVDIGPSRSWSWYCRRPTRLAVRKRKR